MNDIYKRNDFFNLNNPSELKTEILNEDLFIIDMVKCIKLEELRLIKEDQKDYNNLIKHLKVDVKNLMNDIGKTEIETDYSIFSIANNKLKIN